MFLYLKISEQICVPRKGCSVWIWLCSSVPWSDWGFSQLQRQEENRVNTEIKTSELSRKTCSAEFRPQNLLNTGWCSVPCPRVVGLLSDVSSSFSAVILRNSRRKVSPGALFPAAVFSHCRGRPRPRGVAPPAAAGGEQPPERPRRAQSTGAAAGGEHSAERSLMDRSVWKRSSGFNI